MSETVIKVENLSKLYRLGEVGTGTISHDLNRWWAKARGKEDPFAKVGQVNDRTKAAEKGEHVWAVKDINFEVKQGEVLGIIGKNGAGKSTLLKILSRITSPTTGSIKLKGRVASLLEVGTGFHPEMTGKENVYLNGTILGMTRKEIDKKFEEIMDFAGCLKYADTPVKRYSSGMKVRLGFAVAAFLEPEILIVDEVLAVGDAEFQKKAIGKMQDISKGEGRTVLFVSHNMKSIYSLCQRTILLERGRIDSIDDTDKIITRYLHTKNKALTRWSCNSLQQISDFEFQEVFVSQRGNVIESQIRSNLPFEINISYKLNTVIANLSILMRISNSSGDTLFTTWDTDNDQIKSLCKDQGVYKSRLKVPDNLFKPGEYFVTIGAHVPKIKLYELKENLIMFAISEVGYKYNLERDSVFHPNVNWEIVN